MRPPSHPLEPGSEANTGPSQGSQPAAADEGHAAEADPGRSQPHRHHHRSHRPAAAITAMDTYDPALRANSLQPMHCDIMHVPHEQDASHHNHHHSWRNKPAAHMSLLHTACTLAVIMHMCSSTCCPPPPTQLSGQHCGTLEPLSIRPDLLCCTKRLNGSTVFALQHSACHRSTSRYLW